MVWRACWDFGLHFQRDSHVCADQPREVGNDLLGNPAGISSYTGSIKIYGSVKPLRAYALWRGLRWWRVPGFLPIARRLGIVGVVLRLIYLQFGIQLLTRNIWFYQKPQRVIFTDRHHLSCAQPTIASCSFVITFRVSEGVRLPGQKFQTTAY